MVGDMDPWAIARIARVFGLDRPTLTKRLLDEKIPYAKKTAYATYYYPRDVVAMLTGSREKAKAAEEKLSADARFKEARAKTAELKQKQLERELVKADDVTKALSDLLMGVRRKLLAVPTKVAPRLTKAKTPETALALLKAEVNLALEDLANADPSELLPGDIDEDVDDDESGAQENS
jgi:phage terminase Nu1 subunit (DNA packaging protein)